MKSNKQEVEVLEKVERMLATDRPFGDYRYIDGQTWLHYESRLEMLVEHVPEARRTLRAFRKASAQSRYLVIGDPVVRSAINRALTYFKLKGPEIEIEEIKGVLQIAARQLRENSRIAPLAAGAGGQKRLGRSMHHPWIWTDERQEDIPAKSFRSLFARHIANGRELALWTPDESAHEMLLRGTRLLSELLPRLARSALSHAHVIVIGKEPFPITSVTNPSIPGAAFFSPFVLKHSWRAAEYLLHEALHLKFIDLEHTHSMLRRGYSVYNSPKIEALWNRSQKNASNKWPVNRALTVAHTYTCLALLFRMVEVRATELAPRYGPLEDFDPVLSARRALDRAQYLALKLKSVGGELGLAGREFVKWVLEVIESLDPHPRPPGLCAHLLLDLYDRETGQLRTLIANARPEFSTNGRSSSSRLRRLSTQEIVVDMIQRELSTTQGFLSTMRLTSLSPQIEHSIIRNLKGRSPDEISAGVFRLRSEISNSLGKLLVENRSQIPPMNQHVRTLVMGSAGHLRVLSERLGS